MLASAGSTPPEYDYFYTEYDPDTGEPISERKATPYEICDYRKSEEGYCSKGRCKETGECGCRPPNMFYDGDCVRMGCLSFCLNYSQTCLEWPFLNLTLTNHRPNKRIFKKCGHLIDQTQTSASPLYAGLTVNVKYSLNTPIIPSQCGGASCHA